MKMKKRKSCYLFLNKNSVIFWIYDYNTSDNKNYCSHSVLAIRKTLKSKTKNLREPHAGFYTCHCWPYNNMSLNMINLFLHEQLLWHPLYYVKVISRNSLLGTRSRHVSWLKWGVFSHPSITYRLQGMLDCSQSLSPNKVRSLSLFKYCSRLSDVSGRCLFYCFLV